MGIRGWYGGRGKLDESVTAKRIHTNTHTQYRKRERDRHKERERRVDGGERERGREGAYMSVCTHVDMRICMNVFKQHTHSHAYSGTHALTCL